MSLPPLVIRHPSGADVFAIYGISDFGYRSFNAAAWPDRVYAGLDEAARPPSVISEAELDVVVLGSLLDGLKRPVAQEGETLARETRRAIGRLEAMWLLCEDRHRLLDAQSVEPLAHQASLVEHILARPELRRVLIADEVGLGKTIEAALIVKRLIEERSGRPPRVLYLTEAALVDNVAEEFRRLGLEPRRWTRWAQEARLDPGASDPLVIASMHRAAFRVTGGVNHLETVASSGPWDVVIVDEAHHLSDYSSDGTDPQQRMRLVRRLVEERLAPGGRLLLLSGTPHQGHGARFDNLLQLLRSKEEPVSAIRGRVIYRIKEDIRDWDNEPLFPIRKVRDRTLIDCGEDYRQWLKQVHLLLTATGGTRAAGWRRAQALQWCASSPQAGLAYLVRLALRAGLESSNNIALHTAIGALRPYRNHAATQPIQDLEALLRSHVAELEDDDADDFRAEANLLAQALDAGVQLIQRDAIGEKLQAVFRWLDDAPDEKFVLFAQPVETVYTLKSRLESHLGPGTVSLIVGDQDRQFRHAEIDRFRRADGSRALVSSRAGGEGINLQVSRRLVHFDIPWNPMEMEQRVGRVHRYGSTSTVIVDTLVMEDTREERVLDRCRAKLGQIVRDLDRDRLEILYSRTMSLIPLEQLADLMAGEGFGPLTPEEERRVDRLVQEGHQRWLEADAEFRKKSAALRNVERGEARDEDLEAFLSGALGMQREPGWQRRVFTANPDRPEPELTLTDARVYRLEGGDRGYVGRDAGIGFIGPSTEHPRRLGLNDPMVAAQTRGLFQGSLGEPAPPAAFTLTDAHGLRMWSEANEIPKALTEGMLLFAYCQRRLDVSRVPPREIGSTLKAFLTTADGSVEHQLGDSALASLIRLVRIPRPKRTRPTGFRFDRLQSVEESWVRKLKTVSRGEPAVALFPVAILWIQPASSVESGATLKRAITSRVLNQLGDSPWVPIAEAIHEVMERDKYTELTLPGIVELAEMRGFDWRAVQTVVEKLSQPPEPYLERTFVSAGADPATIIPLEEVVARLRASLEEPKSQREAWEAWARTIRVVWRRSPTGEPGGDR